MIARWFYRWRSAAYGFAAMGPPISNLLVPPLVAVLVGALGWRADERVDDRSLEETLAFVADAVELARSAR